MGLSDDLLAWVGRQSQVSRGASKIVENNVASVAVWGQQFIAGSRPQTTVVESVRYPKPTSVVVTWQTKFSSGTFGTNTFPLATIGYPVNVALVQPANYQEQLMVVWVEWSCGGAVFSAICDAGGGSLALGAVEWVRISYSACLFTAGLIPDNPVARIDAAVIPSNMTGLKAKCTSMFVDLTFLIPTVALFGGQPFSRGFTCRFGRDGATDPNLVRVVPVNNFAGAIQSETIAFANVLGSAGLQSQGGVFIPHSSAPIGYQVILPFGAPDTTAKIITEVQVC